MSNLDRINTEVRRGRKLAPVGWATVFILAGVFFGALAILAGR